MEGDAILSALREARAMALRNVRLTPVPQSSQVGADPKGRGNE